MPAERQLLEEFIKVGITTTIIEMFAEIGTETWILVDVRIFGYEPIQKYDTNDNEEINNVFQGAKHDDFIVGYFEGMVKRAVSE